MNELIKAIEAYAYDPEDAELNYKLAEIYYGMGQTASASTFYMRASELTEIKELAYECLIKNAFCYERQGDRKHTVTVLLKHAICLLPNRPEAYFALARLFERTQEYVEGYTYAEIGLQVSDLSLPSLRGYVEYPGYWGLVFEKAVCAWWWGKSVEARALFLYLLDNCYDKLDETHRIAVERNIKTLGSGPKNISFKPYINKYYKRLKKKFPGSDKISSNYSQIYQDMFVLTMLNGKRNGTYLEIGSGDPFYGNNTALLELEFGWKGMGIEFEPNDIEAHRRANRNNLIGKDARYLDYDDILSNIAENGVVDYLQLDCDPPEVTYEIMLKIPFDKYKFAVITYEHDHYLDFTRSFRKKSREFLTSKGYKLVVPNACAHEGAPFEDWWIHPDLVKTVTPFIAPHKITVVEDYMLESKKKSLEPWRATEHPTLEFTTNIAKKGCVVDCGFCPQRTLEKAYNSEVRILTLDNFKKVINKLPKQVRVTFAGFTEPFLNKNCTDMILYAHERGHRISVFTTGVGMTPEDVLRIKHIPFSDPPNGGFVLHLPDAEGIAKHPINENYIKVLEMFKEHQHEIKNFSTMCMSFEVHPDVAHIYPISPVPMFWNRAGNLIGEASKKQNLPTGRVMNAIVSEDPRTCGCVEDLYHNVVLPNGDVSLCCMDYGLKFILGNIFTQSYNDIVPKVNSCFDLCRFCENGVKPKTI